MENPAQQAIENTHVHYVFIMAYARTRDYADAKDAADNAARCLTELPAFCRLLPHSSQACASCAQSFKPHGKVFPDSKSPRT